jgi:hypothetical protein
MGEYNPFKTYCDDVDEDEDSNECSILIDDVKVTKVYK